MIKQAFGRAFRGVRARAETLRWGPHIILGSKAQAKIVGQIVGPGRLRFGAHWPNSLKNSSRLTVAAGSSIETSGRFRVYSGTVIEVTNGATLSLGSGYMNNECRIYCKNGISIGDGVFVGHQVMMMDDDHHLITGARTGDLQIVIEDHVWIGARVTILKGVRVGTGSVIAAGSVVSKDIPPNSLWGGVPARYIRAVAWE